MDLQKKIGTVVGVVAVLCLAVFFGFKIRENRALNHAQEQLNRGFATLAVETLEPVRLSLAGTTRGCRTLVQAYFGAKRVDRLEWASQACIFKGIETPEVYLGLASAAEISGRDGDALQILSATAKKFEKIPEPYYSIAQIFRRNKRDADAVVAFQKAVELAGDKKQIILEALQYFSSLNRWTEARQVADRLKDVQTDNPEIRLIVARALLKGGDAAGGNAQALMAKEMLSKNPELKAAAEKAYPDVFKEKD